MRPIWLKIFHIFCFGAIFYVLDRFADVQTVIWAVRFTYAYPFLCCVSIISGPVVASCSGVIGLLLRWVIEQKSFHWIDVVCIILFCLFTSLPSQKKMNIKDGILGRTDIDTFLKAQIIVNTVVWFIIRPVLYYFVYHVEFLDALDEGLLLAFNRSLSGLLIGSLLLETYTGATYSEAGFYRT